MDFLSLGERFNWDQLVAFVAQIPDTGTLHQLAGEARNAGTQLPVLFAAVQLSGKPAAVAGYLAKFNQTGLKDLGAGLAYGAGGVGELAQRGQRFYRPDWERRVTAFNPFGRSFLSRGGLWLQQPQLALAAKWLALSARRIFAGGGACILRGPPFRRWNVRCRCAGSIWSASFYFRWGFCWWCCS